MKNAQFGIETIFAVGIIIFFVAIVTIVTLYRSQDITYTQTNLEQRDLCYQISNGITSVYSKGPGTTYEIDFKQHKVTFNADSKQVMIDDSYPCTIPLSSIRQVFDGSESKLFTIDKEKITLENKNNIVYVNSRCVSYPISFATDANKQIYTNLVKNSDDQRATIKLTSDIQVPEDLKDYIRTHTIRIAYVRVGGGSACVEEDLQLSNFFTNELECIDTQDFDSDWNDPRHTLCDIYTNTNDLTSLFWPHLNDYSIIFTEDTGNKLENPSNSYTTLNNWVSNGGVLILTRGIQGSPVIAGVSYHGAGGPTQLLTVTSSYYSDPDPYLQFEGSTSSPVSWTPKSNHYVTNNPAQTTQYRDIADFPNGNDGVASWHYGNGFGYYFSSSCETPQSLYDLLGQRIVEALQRIIGTTKFNYLITNLTISPLPETVESFTTRYEYSITNTDPDTEVSLLYYDNTDPNNKWTDACPTLQKSQTEIIATCDISPTAKISQNTAFDLLLRVYQIAKDEQASVDFQDVKICVPNE
ncbi:MAG TPA: hypothetical protein VJJ23_06325 [Candidatus Nanoarchaeia archaeon]|nr:hypothetical protein [Candidatus Nanoarchaeia archaeon]